MSISRKEFLRTAGSTALFAYMGISVVGCSSSSTGPEEEPEGSGVDGLTIDGFVLTVNLSASSFSSLLSEGGKVLSLEGAFLAVNVDGENIRVFTNVCTHTRCTDQWSFSPNQFTCNCHGSTFNNAGEVTGGPANGDLTEYQVTRTNNTIVIDKTVTV